MRRHEVKTERRGDTLIEVMLSISIFAFVAMLTINMMNNGINTAQRTLEEEMARNEIDAQAEALRFIHNSYVSERQKMENQSQFRKIWKRLIDNSIRPSSTAKTTNADGKMVPFDINEMNTCEDAYGSQAHLGHYGAFVLNTRLIVPELSTDGKFEYLGYSYNGTSSAHNNDNLMNHMIAYYSATPGKFQAPALYPRIIYGKLNDDGKGSKTNTSATINDTYVGDDAALDEGNNIYNDIAVAEGVWINAVSNIDVAGRTGADYYDFYIRTCWHASGMRTPSTITTVVRLYNPEVME